MTHDAPAQFVDLHCHSTASDGTLAPAAVVRLARDSGLVGLSLTDHDTVDGVEEAAREARALGIAFLPGIEISCEYPHAGTMHLLGYAVDPHSNVLRSLTERLIEAREHRNPRIIQRLNELGVAITMEEVEQQADGGVIGRPHVAAVLLRKGYVSSTRQAFDKYLGTTGLAYFDKERIAPRRALELIRRSGGLPVLAHPSQLRTANDAELDRVVKDLADLGLVGLEVIHSDHDSSMIERLTRLAEKYRLLKTGGSDFHGSNKSEIALGWAQGRRVPRQWFDALWEQAAPAGRQS
jgi:3',5'-nucleoside bisphosphate phosphatase